MSYHIGQVRKDNSVTYLTEVENLQYYYGSNHGGIVTKGYGGKPFYDFAIGFPPSGNSEDVSNTFNANEDYYLRFTIKRQPHKGHIMPDISDDSVYVLNLRLLKNNNSSGEYRYGDYQTISTGLVFEPYLENINEPYVGYETIFRPRDSGYKYLAFILSRTQKDYYNTQGQTIPRSIYSDIEQSIFIQEDYIEETNIKETNIEKIKTRSPGDLCVINNILPGTAGNQRYAMEKIGIQTNPGTLICVNHEPIRVGRSGIYEVNNGVKVYSVGICAPDGNIPNNINDFILDYAYDDTTNTQQSTNG